MNKAAQQLGRLGGKTKTEAKSEAAKKNGAKGGRPRIWFFDGDFVNILAITPGSAALQAGRIHLQIKSDTILDVMGNEVEITQPDCDTVGWGSLSGKKEEMVLINGHAITKKAWLDSAIAAARKFK